MLLLGILGAEDPWQLHLRHDSLGCLIFDRINATVCLLRCVSAEGVCVLPFSRALRLLFVLTLDSVKPHIRSQPATLSHSNTRTLLPGRSSA